MFRWILLAGACAIATPAAAKTFTYDCDTAPDHYSEIAAPLAEGSSVSGTVAPSVIAPGRNHLTAATILIRGGETSVGFQLYAGGRDNVDAVIVSMIIHRGDKRDETVIRTLKLKQSVRFRLALGKDGLVSLDLDDWKHSEKVALGASSKVTVGCSTGEFLFESLDFDG